MQPSSCPKCGRRFLPSMKPPVVCACTAVIGEKPKAPKVQEAEQQEVAKFAVLPEPFEMPSRYTIEQVGRDSWKLLHEYEYSTPEECEKWYRGFWLKTIPRFSCDCGEYVKKVEDESPPDFSGKESFRRWGWNLHNLVNKKLEKPKLSFDEAAEIHGWKKNG